MASTVYLLCALTCLLCTILLARAYARSRVRLLFWSLLCFGLMTAANVLLYIDLAMVPAGPDLRPWRTGLSLAAVSALLYGLLTETP